MKSLLALFLMIPSSLWAVDWGQASIIDGGRDENGRNWIGIEITLNEGWKTYWQYAGQNGLDPLIELTLNGENVVHDITWPMPHLFLADDLPSVGYKGSVIIPLSFEAPEGSSLNLTADFGVCETVCVPAQFDFAINAHANYNFDQVMLKSVKGAENAPVCEWSQEALATLDPNGYWMFVSNDGGVIEHRAPMNFVKGQVYHLDETAIAPLPCAR